MRPQDPLSNRLRALAELYEEEVPAARSEQIAARAVARARVSSGGTGLVARRAMALSVVGVFALVAGIALGMLVDSSTSEAPLADDSNVMIVGSKYAVSQQQLQQAMQLLNEGRTSDAMPIVRQALEELKLPSTTAGTSTTTSATSRSSDSTSPSAVAATTETTPQAVVLRLAVEHLLRVIQTVEETDGNGVLESELEEAAANLAAAAEQVESTTAATDTAVSSSTTSTTTSTSTSSTTTIPDENTTTTSEPDGKRGDPIILPPQP